MRRRPLCEAIRNSRRCLLQVESLDARALLSGFSPFSGFVARMDSEVSMANPMLAERRTALLAALETRRAIAPISRFPGDPPLAPRPISRPSVLFQATPLTDLGKGFYRGQQGGLYPGGFNQRPEVHEQAGLERSGAVQSLDRNGLPADDGKIVLLSVGMSNTSMEFQAFQQITANDPQINPDLVIVNGAQNGASIDRLVNRPAQARQYFRAIDARLSQAGVSAEQVQVVWIKQAAAGPRGAFPQHAQSLQHELARLTRMLKARYPNLQLAYVSSRTFGGYASIPLNPEPFAFESGFAVKWLIEQQIDGDPSLNFDPDRGPAEVPWLSWGPYLWASGTNPRGDGLSYSRTDFAADGTHPSPSGARKVATLLLDFFKSDRTTRPWFVSG